MGSEEKSLRSSTTSSPATRALLSSAPQNLAPLPGSSLEETFSQPRPFANISFLGLNREIRDNIYKRVLIVAHPLFLFQDPGAQVEVFGPEKPPRWLALLYTNRQMHSEASAVLYGMNVFTLVDTAREQTNLLQSFLNCVGSVNAGYLTHLCITFPVVENVEGQPGRMKLRDDSLQTLKLLQETCTSITTLETNLQPENYKAVFETDGDKSKLFQEALLQIDAQLKDISSLKKVIVKFNAKTAPPSVIESIQRLGWIVLTDQK